MHSGETVTASQASKRFGIKNISADVSRIRQAGFAVYANQRVAGNGVKVTEYVIGKPSRKDSARDLRSPFGRDLRKPWPVQVILETCSRLY